MDLWIVLTLISVSCSLGICIGGFLASSVDPEDWSDLAEEYQRGLEDGRAQAHRDYAAMNHVVMQQRDQREAK